MTVPERLLWGLLRNRGVAGMKFRRQHPIPPFVADYACIEPKLVVELDGMTHVGAGQKDEARTDFLARQGYRVVRVTNDEVLQNPQAVVEMIAQTITCQLPETLRGSTGTTKRTGNLQAPSPQPSPKGRGGRRA